MTNRRIRNARLVENVGHAAHDPRTPVRTEVVVNRETGVRWVKDVYDAHAAHHMKKIRGV
jgi:hypothetical protein